MEQPNILFIMPDQLRADFLSCYGANFIRTPHIDSLCTDGVRYTRAVSPSPLCVPARASLLTGLNALKTGVLSNDQWLRPDHEECGVRTWPQILAAAGYHTAAIGKMHFYPWDAREGFAHRVIAEDKRHIHIQDDYHHYLRRHGLKKFHGNEHDGYFENKGAIISKIPAEHQVDTWVANQACAFIEAHRHDAPFALMVGLPGPHCPYDPPPELASLFEPDAMPESIPATADSAAFRESVIAGNLRAWNQVDYTDFSEPQKKKMRAHYAALVHQIDQAVGRMLASVRRAGLEDNTIIIFASDHGDFLGDFDFVGKNLFYETSLRVPLIARHPRYHAGQTVSDTVSLTDIYATILQCAGAQGIDSTDSLVLPGFGQDARARRPSVFGATATGIMITDERWKLARYRNGATMLFDLQADPLEQQNLAYQPAHAETLRQLDRVLQQELLPSVVAGHSDKVAVTHDQDPAFSLPGQDRAYPHVWHAPQ